MYLWQLTNNQQKLVGVADPVSAVCGKALSVGQGDGQHQFQLLFVFQLRNGESDVSQISLKLIFCIGFVKGQCLLAQFLAIVGQKYGLALMSFEPGRGPKIGSHVMKFSMDSGNADYNPFESFKKAAMLPEADDECAMMVLHPGFVDEYVLTTSYITTQRALEVAFATNPEVPAWCEANNVKLMTYADL